MWLFGPIDDLLHRIIIIRYYEILQFSDLIHMLVLPLFDCATPYKQQNKLLIKGLKYSLEIKILVYFSGIFIPFWTFKFSKKKKLCKILCKTVCQCNSIWTSEFHNLFVVMKDILMWFAYIYIKLNINFIFFYWKYWPIFS